MFLQCLASATDVIKRVEPDQLDDPTPDTDWDVAALACHMLYELSWTTDIINGKTLAEVGDKYENIIVDGDLSKNWQAAAERAKIALASADMAATAHLSYGDVTVEAYLWQAGTDQLIHSWDLGTALGKKVIFNPSLAGAIYDYALPKRDSLAVSGLFAPPLPVGETADIQTKLLALYGRNAGEAL